jgi:hypothetical protein
MWSNRQTLAEFRVYTSLTEDEDAQVESVHAYLTRSIISERRYQEEFYPESDKDSSEDVLSPSLSNFSEDLSCEELDVADESSALCQDTLENNLKQDQSKLSKRLSTLGLGHFELSSSDSEDSESSSATGTASIEKNRREQLNKYLEGAAVLAEIIEDTDSLSLGDPESLLLQESVASECTDSLAGEDLSDRASDVIDLVVDDPELYQAMGLPRKFGPQTKAHKRKVSLVLKLKYTNKR